MMSFPPDFVWGAATASYQIEGAVAEDGRGPSIWDTFAHTPGAILDSTDRRRGRRPLSPFADDIAILADLGLTAYRFSRPGHGSCRRAPAPSTRRVWTSTGGSPRRASSTA